MQRMGLHNLCQSCISAGPPANVLEGYRRNDENERGEAGDNVRADKYEAKNEFKNMGKSMQSALVMARAGMKCLNN